MLDNAHQAAQLLGPLLRSEVAKLAVQREGVRHFQPLNGQTGSQLLGPSFREQIPLVRRIEVSRDVEPLITQPPGRVVGKRLKNGQRYLSASSDSSNQLKVPRLTSGSPCLDEIGQSS